MLFEVILGVLSVICLLNLLISWINLNLIAEIKEGFVEFLHTTQPSSNTLRNVASQITEIENYLAELMNVMGNPFQMLAATHGARILERFFPPKIEPVNPDDLGSGHDALLSTSTSGETWQDARHPQNEGEVDAQPE